MKDYLAVAYFRDDVQDVSIGDEFTAGVFIQTRTDSSFRSSGGGCECLPFVHITPESSTIAFQIPGGVHSAFG